MLIVTEPACAAHPMLALSTHARTASSSAAPSPRSELRFKRSPVPGVAVQEMDGVDEDRNHSLEGFGGALDAARYVDHKRGPSHSGQTTRKSRHRRARRSGAPHRLGQAGYLVVEQRRGGLWG